MDTVDFVVQLGATLIGVLLGIPAGLYLDRVVKSGETTQERRRLLKFFKRNLETNIRLLAQSKAELPRATIYYNLDLGAWPAVSEKVHLLRNDSLAEGLCRLYYELEHISRKVNLQFEMAFSTFSAIVGYGQIRSDLVMRGIIPHIDAVLREADRLLQAINAKLGETTQPTPGAIDPRPIPPDH
ncbi:MAG: hypothetical protein ABIE25_06365 [Thermoplasmatota archaeon]